MFLLRDQCGIRGPFTSEQLRAMATSRLLHTAMEIRKESGEKWTPLANLEKLAPMLVAPPQQQPPPARPVPVVKQPIAVDPQQTTAGQVAASVNAMGEYYAGKKASSASHSLGIAGLVVGVIGILLFWAPLSNTYSMLLATPIL